MQEEGQQGTSRNHGQANHRWHPGTVEGDGKTQEGQHTIARRVAVHAVNHVNSINSTYTREDREGYGEPRIQLI